MLATDEVSPRLWIISGHDHGGYAAPNNGNGHDLPTMPSMVDMLTITMSRLLPAIDMDMLHFPMADMLLSATDMTLLINFFLLWSKINFC